MLEIKDLHAGVDGNEIVNGVTLSINKGEIHAIMGPNGSGKSTLAKVLSGHPAYEITAGQITFEGKDLLELDAEQRSIAGIFMGFQYPVEVPGVNNAELLRMAHNARRVNAGEEEIDPLDFDELLSEKMKMLGMEKKYKERNLNDGFRVVKKRKMKFYKWLSFSLGCPF